MPPIPPSAQRRGPSWVDKCMSAYLRFVFGFLTLSSENGHAHGRKYVFQTKGAEVESS